MASEEHRIKTEKVDVCAVCSWRGVPGDWEGHVRSWEHRINRIRHDARKADLVQLYADDFETTRWTKIDGNKAIVHAIQKDFPAHLVEKALGVSAVAFVPYRTGMSHEMGIAAEYDQVVIVTEPFVRSAVKLAINTYRELPKEVRSTFLPHDYLRAMFQNGAPVNFTSPL